MLGRKFHTSNTFASFDVNVGEVSEIIFPLFTPSDHVHFRPVVVSSKNNTFVARATVAIGSRVSFKFFIFHEQVQRTFRVRAG